MWWRLRSLDNAFSDGAFVRGITRYIVEAVYV